MDVLPTHISQYEISRVLGQGGMGIVYLAFDPALHRQVALKVLRTDNEEQRERFRREARIVARLQHPNIVAIYGVGEHEGHPFIAMEYIAGEPLSEAVRRRAPWGLQRKLMMGAEICAGLAFAHRAGVIHRDVKPSNLIVSNGSGTIRLLDFGIARGADAGATMGLTMQGNIVGTLNYMSPEQITGRPIDHRSDVFAVGLVMYELITYRKAFPGDNLATLTYRIVHGSPDPIRTLQPDADEELCAVIDRAMAREPDARHPHLDAMRADLIRIAARLSPSAATRLAPDDSGEQGLPPPPAIWSRALDATSNLEGPETPGPIAATVPAAGVEPAAPDRLRRAWPVVVAVAGITLGGATALWLTSGTPEPARVEYRNRPAGERKTFPQEDPLRRAANDPIGTPDLTPGTDVAAAVPPAVAAPPPASPPASPGVAEAPARTATRPTAQARPPATEQARPGVTTTAPPRAIPPALPSGRESAAATEAGDPVPATPAVVAPPPPATVEPRPVPAGPTDEEQVRAVLDRWARAYSSKDAQGVDAVQPGSAAALEKAFSQMRSVDVALSGCRVEVQDTRATAACTERLRTESIVAGGNRDQSRARQFTLQKSDGRWRIASTRFGR